MKNKTRINVSLPAELHEFGKQQARQLKIEDGFSGYVSKLIRDDRGDLVLSGDDVRALPAPVRELLKATSRRRREIGQE